MTDDRGPVVEHNCEFTSPDNPVCSICGIDPVVAAELTALRGELEHLQGMIDVGTESHEHFLATHDKLRAGVKEKLEWVCKFYCDKYDGTNYQKLDWASVSYEMVSMVRRAIALLRDGEKDNL